MWRQFKSGLQSLRFSLERTGSLIEFYQDSITLYTGSSTWTVLWNLLHKFHSAPVSFITMHHFVTEMCTCVYFCYKIVYYGIFVSWPTGWPYLTQYILHLSYFHHFSYNTCTVTCSAMFKWETTHWGFCKQYSELYFIKRKENSCILIKI